MEDKKINEVAENEVSLPKAEKSKKATEKSLVKKLKSARPKKLKNELLYRKGGFSVAITACILVAIILFNWLVGTLADRFDLELDMTSSKQNTISEENAEYIKNIETEVSLIFCADEKDYADGMMSQYASYYYSVSDSNDSSYYSQTINLVKKYADLNKKIKLEFIDTQTTEFAQITSDYATDNIAYGDIVVSAEVKGKDGKTSKRHKIISYEDIYTLSDETGYAQYYGGYTIGGNNIETRLTSAIAYVCSSDSKKVAMLTGHATHGYSENYRTLLEENNYEVTIIDDVLINEISSEFDIAVLVAPNKDFIGSELDAISKFLDNNDKLGKGLIYFADATVPALENLNSFLAEWGIEVGNGILLETNEQFHMEGDPFTMAIFPSEDEINSGLTYCITGYNAPLLASEPASEDISVTELQTTSTTVVEAPKGANAGWKDYSESDLAQYASVIQSEKLDYDNDNNEITSYVMAFSSVEFVYSEWAEYENLSNKNISLAVADRAAKVDDTGISFTSKTITNESFADTVTASNVALIRIFFMILLPIVTILVGVVIFIRRKNA